MAIVRRDGIAIECRDEVQLDAFLSNGWVVVKEEVAKKPPLSVEKPTVEPQEEKRKTGRKKKESGGEIGKFFA